MLVMCVYIIVGAGVSTLMSISDGLSHSIIRQQMEKTRLVRGRDGLEKCLFSTAVGNSAFIFVNESTFPHLYLDLACKQLCFPPRKRYKQEKKNYTKHD